MKKILHVLASAFLAMTLNSCGKHIEPTPPPTNEPEMVTVSFECKGDIADVSLVPMSKADISGIEDKYAFGLGVYILKDGSYRPYGAGIYEDISHVSLQLPKGETFQFKALMAVPLSEYGINMLAYEPFTLNDSRINYFPQVTQDPIDLKTYFSAVNDVVASKDMEVGLNLKAMHYGIEFVYDWDVSFDSGRVETWINIDNGYDGNIGMSMDVKYPNTISSSIISYSPNRMESIYNDISQGEVNTGKGEIQSIKYRDTENNITTIFGYPDINEINREDLFTFELNRNTKTIIHVKINSLNNTQVANTNFNVSIDESDMVDGTPIYIGY